MQLGIERDPQSLPVANQIINRTKAMNKRANLILLSSSLLMAGGALADQANTVETTVSNGERKTIVSQMTVEEKAKSESTKTEAKKTSRARRLNGSIVEVNPVNAEDSSVNKIGLVIAVTLDQRYTMSLTVPDNGQTFRLGDAVSVSGNLDADDGKVYFTPSSVFSQGNATTVLNQDAVELNKGAALVDNPEPDKVRVKGPVDWYQKVTIQGLDDEDEVIRVHMADGTSDLIHLGKGPREFKLGLEKGEVIEAVGEEKIIDGKVILFATEVYVDGEPKL